VLSALLPFTGPAKINQESVYTPMANIASQKKRNLQNEVRRVRNKGVRSEMRTRIKNARAALTDETVDATESLRAAQKRIDKAGRKGVIHKNTAARRNSRLMKAANKAASETAE